MATVGLEMRTLVALLLSGCVVSLTGLAAALPEGQEGDGRADADAVEVARDEDDPAEGEIVADETAEHEPVQIETQRTVELGDSARKPEPRAARGSKHASTRATPRTPRHSGIEEVRAAWSMAPVAPVLTVARAGGFQRTWLGAALLSMNGNAWFLPESGDHGLVARAGGRLALVEALPLGIYGSDLSAAIGYRRQLSGDHHFALLGGAQGSGGYPGQHAFASLRFPEAELAYQLQGKRAFVEVGALGGLWMVGRYAMGEKIVAAVDEPKDYFSNSAAFKASAGLRVSVVVPHFAALLWARRAFTGEGSPGGSLDHAQGSLCFNLSDRPKKPAFGGCLLADAYRGEVARVEPVSGPSVDASSYRVTLNVGVAQTRLP